MKIQQTFYQLMKLVLRLVLEKSEKLSFRKKMCKVVKGIKLKCNENTEFLRPRHFGDWSRMQ